MQITYLRLHDFEFQVHLGVYPEEQSHPQTILLNATIEMHLSSMHLESDNINSYICYDDLIREIKSKINNRKSFKTIETLTGFLWKNICITQNKGVLIELSITKKQIPISVNAKGVSFTICRQPEAIYNESQTFISLNSRC